MGTSYILETLPVPKSVRQWAWSHQTTGRLTTNAPLGVTAHSRPRQRDSTRQRVVADVKPRQRRQVGHRVWDRSRQLADGLPV